MSTPLNELTLRDIMEGVGTPNVDDLFDDGPLLMPRDSVESVSSLPKTDGKRRRRSTVWDSFKVNPGDKYDDGKERAECLKCKIVYRVDTNINGTGTLRRHLKNCLKQDNKDIKQMMLGKNQGKLDLKERKIDLDLAFENLQLKDNNYKSCLNSNHWLRIEKIKFIDCCKELSLSTAKGLHADVCTRWNSTYHMIESALFYRQTFENLQLKDNNYKSCPNSNHWLRIEKLTSFLQPFDEITILLSGSKYPTANLYFLNVWKIHKSILEEMAHHDSFMKDMVVEMKKFFDKYWNEYSLILAIALVFDPRYKLTFVEWAFQKIASLDPLACDMSFRVKSALVRLFNEYKSMDAADIETPTPSSSYVGPTELAEFLAFKSVMLIDSYGKSQLDLYLEEPHIPFNDNYREFDVLAYWR
ncbi:hypothetical protein NE237_000136 [Protea cynaroides]|uniref:BED-type domain-containing protein n=1 Tax=Protea cynaroides TaxID=273540 RepID=A0A9Q0GL64_9MAGN|nr:hypothetical protein NE237_000136 [Protea cynaroides]